MKEEISPAATHRKSRFGCKTCKQRKVKCDEAKPICSNCSKRSLICDYGLVYAVSDKDARSRTASEPSVSVEASDEKRKLRSEASRDGTVASTVDGFTITNTSELELMHHYTALTCYTIFEDGSPAEQSLWQFHVPQVGFRYRPVMQLILSLSAWHLRTLRPAAQAERLMLCAIDHFSQALPQFSSDLIRLERRTYDALFFSATLVGLCQFARGPKTGDYIAFTEDERDGEIYKLLCGAKHIIISGKADQVPSEQSLDREMVTRAPPPPPPPPSPPPSKRVRREIHYKPHIRRLETHIHNLTAEDGSFSKYLDSLRVLEGLFADRFEASASSNGQTKPVFHWLYTLSEDYMAALRAKKPLALVIFGYFAVLLDDMRGLWFMDGWSRHVMTGVHKHLHSGYHEWIAWPTEVVGLDPRM